MCGVFSGRPVISSSYPNRQSEGKFCYTFQNTQLGSVYLPTILLKNQHSSEDESSSKTSSEVFDQNKGRIRCLQYKSGERVGRGRCHTLQNNKGLSSFYFC